jgi:hypothetical protein
VVLTSIPFILVLFAVIAFYHKYQQGLQLKAKL